MSEISGVVSPSPFVEIAFLDSGARWPSHAKVQQGIDNALRDDSLLFPHSCMT
jgi:hypothetical protein